MKTRIFTCIVLFTLAIVGVYAQNPDWVNKTKKDSSGNPVSVVSYSDNVPAMKTEYQYDPNGNRIVKELYTWDSKASKWVEVFRIDYLYSEKDQLSMCTNSKWNKKNKDWSNDVQYMIYLYDSDGVLLSVKNSKTKNDVYNRLSQR